MKRKIIIICLLLFSSFTITSQTTAAYLSNTSQPWNQNSNILAFNKVYDEDYTHYTYSSANIADIFISTRKFIWLEGSKADTQLMLNVINDNKVLIENWVSNGGVLVINAATNSIYAPYSVGFGITSTRYINASVVPSDVNHPFFKNATYTPILASSYSGNSVAHNYITGPGLTPILSSTNGQQVVLAEKSFGNGLVLFSGLTTPFFISQSNWRPKPQTPNLLYEMLAYGGTSASPSDTTPPTITLISPGVQMIEVGNAYTELNATATDDTDGDISNKIVIASAVNTSIVDTYIVTYNVSDAAGNPADEVTRTVNVVDTTKPVITLSGATTVTIEVGDAYLDSGATATDTYDDNAVLTSNIITVSDVDTSVVGNYTVKYNVMDTAGNPADEVTRTVKVVDTTKPVITLSGVTTVTIEVGDAYLDLGATATDTYDDNAVLTSNIITVSDVDTSVVGNYTVKYNVMDAAGNPADEVTRTVKVVDTTLPIITITGETPQVIQAGSLYLDLGATATDTYDDNGVLTSNIAVISDVDTSVLGIYSVRYNVTDANLNVADEVTRTVEVVDTTLPIITITGETPQVIQAGSLYLDLGATATDTYDNNGVLTSNIAVISDVDTSVLGIYSVRYNVTDSNLNVADEVTRTVEVIDTTLPVLTLLGETPQIVEIGKLYLESGAQAEDNLDGDVTAAIVIDATNVDTAIPSSYIVTYNVTDANTNVAQELQRTVLVLSNRPTAVDDAISSPIAYNSKDNLVNVLANDSFGFDGAIDKGLTMVNGTSSNASSNGGAIRVERNNTLDTMDDVILYSSPEDFSGVDTFKYTITDATGHASTAIATVTVSDQRTDIPTAVKDAFPVISDTETLLDVLANDNFGTDGAGSLSLSGITISTAGFVLSIDPGATIAVSDDTVKYAPTGGFTGTDSFTYTLIDANGDIATATVKLTVRSAKPVNGKPIAVDDVLIEALVYNSIENSIAVLSNDNFGTDGPNATHSLRLLKGRRSSISANKGVITLADDVILYSAPKDFIGADTFQYVITDASGDASTGSVTLTVAGEVIIPGPVADFVSVDQNSVDNLIDVVANDNLGENGFGRMLIMSPFHLTAPTTEGGVINLFDNGTPADATDDKILYTPPTGFIGTDTFAYYLEVDGVEYTNGSVTITINLVAPVNGTPTAVDDDVTAPLVYNSKDNEIDVLANDDFGSDGAIDKGLTMVNGTSSNASANGGEIRVERKNTLDTMDDVILYSAPKDFSGVDTFKYTITDLSGEASTATATITVLEQVTDVPIAENDAIAVILDTETLLNVLANDNFGTDGAGSLGLNGVTTSAAGFAISINAGATPNVSDDRVSYTPTGGFIGTDSFSYIITDANGDIATAEVILTVVTPENTEPTANNDDETVAINSVDNILNVTLNDDYGAEGENATHALRLRNGKSSTESTKGGKISVDNGNILYTPPTAFDGVDSFIYIITDASGDASWATVTVSVVIPKTETIDQGDDVTIENKFLVYPNPSNGYVKTMVYSTVKTSATILLFDVTGKVIYSAVKELATGKNEVDFNVNVKPGVLFLRVISKEVNFGTSKIVFK